MTLFDDNVDEMHDLFYLVRLPDPKLDRTGSGSIVASHNQKSGTNIADSNINLQQYSPEKKQVQETNHAYMTGYQRQDSSILHKMSTERKSEEAQGA